MPPSLEYMKKLEHVAKILGDTLFPGSEGNSNEGKIEDIIKVLKEMTQGEELFEEELLEYWLKVLNEYKGEVNSSVANVKTAVTFLQWLLEQSEAFLSDGSNSAPVPGDKDGEQNGLTPAKIFSQVIAAMVQEKSNIFLYSCDLYCRFIGAAPYSCKKMLEFDDDSWKIGMRDTLNDVLSSNNINVPDANKAKEFLESQMKCLWFLHAAEGHEHNKIKSLLLPAQSRKRKRKDSDSESDSDNKSDNKSDNSPDNSPDNIPDNSPDNNPDGVACGQYEYLSEGFSGDDDE